VDRGLLFLAYQTSIVDQFEFVTKNWVNNADFKENGTGFDPIIGQNSVDPTRRRTFKLGLPRRDGPPIETDQDWVVPDRRRILLRAVHCRTKGPCQRKQPAKIFCRIQAKRAKKHKGSK